MTRPATRTRKPAAAVAVPAASPAASHGFDGDDWRWKAVVDRDARAAGRFVYSVKTTGVYCRPGCGARLPRRENVAFHLNGAAAQQRGFRACKRCRPDDGRAEPAHAAAVARACALIMAAEQAPSLATLAQAAGLSPAHFQRLFKAQTGVTPKGYATAHRSRRVREALARPGKVTAAIYHAGFSSSGRFYATATRVLGMTPTTFRAGGDGTRIVCGVGTCALGLILVAASPLGICSIALGDDADMLRQELRCQFPRADIVEGDQAFDQLIARVVAFVDRPARGLDLPLAVQGTAFQHRVWRALQDIPCGETRSYAALAAALGMPAATRAVAGACAANMLAIAIPCHRVVRTDHTLSGYRWGVARKAALLARERQNR